MSDTLKLKRPEGITDGRWAALRSLAALVVTGHAPWCEDHYDSDGEPNGGWCTRTIRSFCAEVTISNGSVSGVTEIGLFLNSSTLRDQLSPSEAAAIASSLHEAANLVKMGNLND